MTHVRMTAAAALMAAALGCSPSAPDVGPPPQFDLPPQELTGNTLKGKVTINGSPMPQGYVFVYSSKAPVPMASGMIGPNGEYTAENVPLGPVQLVVTSDTSGIPPYAPGLQGPPSGPEGPDGPNAGPPGVAGPPGMGGPPGPPKGKPKQPSGDGAAELTPQQKKLLDAVDGKYGSLTSEQKIQYTVASGENTYDIVLEVK